MSLEPYSDCSRKGTIAGLVIGIVVDVVIDALILIYRLIHSLIVFAHGLIHGLMQLIPYIPPYILKDFLHALPLFIIGLLIILNIVILTVFAALIRKIWCMREQTQGLQLLF
jgi:hypothetical protein